MTELQVVIKMFERVGIPYTHKRNPSWATTDRILISAAGTLLSFCFGKDGDFQCIAWGNHQDQV